MSANTAERWPFVAVFEIDAFYILGETLLNVQDKLSVDQIDSCSSESTHLEWPQTTYVGANVDNLRLSL